MHFEQPTKPTVPRGWRAVCPVDNGWCVDAVVGVVGAMHPLGKGLRENGIVGLLKQRHGYVLVASFATAPTT